MLTKHKKAVALSTGIAALIAGACLSARPAAALPMTLSMSHLTRPVYDHDNDVRQDRWQHDNQWRGNHDADYDRREQENRLRAERERREREEQRRRYEDRHHDRDDHDRR